MSDQLSLMRKQAQKITTLAQVGKYNQMEIQQIIVFGLNHHLLTWRLTRMEASDRIVVQGSLFQLFISKGSRDSFYSTSPQVCCTRNELGQIGDWEWLQKNHLRPKWEWRRSPVEHLLLASRLQQIPRPSFDILLLCLSLYMLIGIIVIELHIL